MTEGDGLTAKQLQAISILAIQLNVEKACVEIGISKNTYYKWMKSPIFSNALRRKREEIGKEAFELFKVASKRAASVLVQLLGEENPPGVRRAAANDILFYLEKIKENQDPMELWGIDGF